MRFYYLYTVHIFLQVLYLYNSLLIAIDEVHLFVKFIVFLLFILTI